MQNQFAGSCGSIQDTNNKLKKITCRSNGLSPGGQLHLKDHITLGETPTGKHATNFGRGWAMHGHAKYASVLLLMNGDNTSSYA